MLDKLFNELIDSNKKTWSKINVKTNSNGYLLYEAFYNEPALIYGITKTALIIADIKNLKPIGIESLNVSSTNHALNCSMNDFLIGSKKHFLLSFLKNIFPISRCFAGIKSGDDLLNLTVGKYKIGPYIYDAILRALSISVVATLNVKIKKRVLLELCYFFYFKDLIETKNIKAIVIGDNVYRYGFLFELARYNKVECISPINLNAYTLRKYSSFEDFSIHDRTPERETLDKLKIEEVNEYLNNYFHRRFSADIEQHDVLKAFSKSKKILSRNEVIDEYNLNIELPIVIVMAHIFSDAPHAYPGTIYDNYHDWFCSTVRCLKTNKRVNLLVKEHPSADLYNEKGIVKKLLSELACEEHLLRDDVHSLTILNEFDVVVTCGGTIGQEFVYKGKPVVLGARPPYSGFGFTTEPNGVEEYERLLMAGVEQLPLLSQSQREMANRVIYHDFVLLNNYEDDLELGGQRVYLGRELDYESFLKKVLSYNSIELKEQKIYRLLKKFFESDSKLLIRDYNAA